MTFSSNLHPILGPQALQLYIKGPNRKKTVPWRLSWESSVCSSTLLKPTHIQDSLCKNCLQRRSGFISLNTPYVAG